MTIKNAFFKEVSKNSNSNIPKEYVILPGDSADYEVDYEEEAKHLMRINRDELVRKSDFLNVIINNGQSVIKSKQFHIKPYRH